MANSYYYTIGTTIGTITKQLVLTVPMLAEVVFSWLRSITHTSLVVSFHSKLVDHLFLEPLNLVLRFGLR